MTQLGLGDSGLDRRLGRGRLRRGGSPTFGPRMRNFGFTPPSRLILPPSVCVCSSASGSAIPVLAPVRFAGERRRSLPEPGFPLALYYAVSDDNAVGKRAVDWALGKADDLRQLALVYDWCQPILSPEQSAALAAKIRQLAQGTGDSIAGSPRLRPGSYSYCGRFHSPRRSAAPRPGSAMVARPICSRAGRRPHRAAAPRPLALLETLHAILVVPEDRPA